MKSDELQQVEYPIEWGLYYDKNKVDAAIAELKAENQRLKKCEIWMMQHFYCEEVIACESAKNRKLKRALWLARAKNASYNVKDRQRIINRELDQERPDIEFIHHHEKVKQKWMNVKSICKKKAEEYK